MYAITLDRGAARIVVRITGLLTLEEVTRFIGELSGHVRDLRMAGKQQTILYDYTDAVIQPQDVVAALQELATSDRFHSKRVALYTGGQLARAQARRIAGGHERFAIFDDRAAAVAWLDAA